MVFMRSRGFVRLTYHPTSLGTHWPPGWALDARTRLRLAARKRPRGRAAPRGSCSLNRKAAVTTAAPNRTVSLGPVIVLEVLVKPLPRHRGSRRWTQLEGAWFGLW